MTDDQDLMAALYLGPDYEIACRLDWEDEPAEEWSRLWCYEEVAAGILRLIRERDEAREQLVELEAENTRAWMAIERRAMEGSRMPDFTDLDERIALKKALREAQQTAETFRTSIYALEERVSQLIKERDNAREDALEQIRERNEARAQLRLEQGVVRQLTRQRDDAQEAAEEYWEAWIDAQTYWKEKVERLESRLDNSRAANGLRQRRLDAATKHWTAWSDAAAMRLEENNRLREALKRYGSHDAVCDIHLRRECSCGLAAALENH